MLDPSREPGEPEIFVDQKYWNGYADGDKTGFPQEWREANIASATQVRICMIIRKNYFHCYELSTI